MLGVDVDGGAVDVTGPRAPRPGAAARGHDHPLREALHQQPPHDRARRRDQEDGPEDVGDEARREQEGAAEDHQHAVEHLARRRPPGLERLVEAPPRDPPLRAHQQRAEDRVGDQDRDRPPDADLLADLDDHGQLRDRDDDEDDEQHREHVGPLRYAPAMSFVNRLPFPRWTVLVPPLAVVLLAITWGHKPPGVVLAIVGAFLAGAVLAAVHHAEVVAHRVGEPFGSLVLAVAVTVIEVALIVTLMVSGKESETATLARDTVFAAVMITCNGIVGLSLLVGTLRTRFAEFNAEGTATALATVSTLATLTLVLPTFTTSRPGPEFSGAQLAFAAVASLALYGLFVFIQTVRHRDYFLPEGTEHAERPTNRETWISLGLLVVALVAVVGLAKVESPAIEDAVASVGAPHSAVGVVIALLVLLPETLAAWRNARRDRMQVSFNLALGSGMASIGLTIPAIAIASIWLDGPLVLGLGATQMVLLAITVVLSALTILPGRATLQEGGVHLVLFVAFVFLAFNP